MNAKSFRRNHGAKTRSSSSSFISLHFNKADEDQLEFSYKEEKRPKEDAIGKSAAESKFTLYIPDSRKSTDHLSSEPLRAVSDDTDRPLALNNELVVPHSDSTKSNGAREDIRCAAGDGKLSRGSFVEFMRLDPEPHLDSSSTLEDDPKLSPAVEAAEIEDKNDFDHFLSSKLEKAKQEMPDDKREPSPFVPRDSSVTPLSEKLSVPEERSRRSELLFYKNCLCRVASFVSFSRNSVPFHLLVVVLACVCAPIPSWLSGFLVGGILSGSLVHWLYRPQKKRRSNSFSHLLPHSSLSRKQPEDSDILKGWMNELPSPMSYHPERYHVSCTRSVYVRLDGSYVRLSFPARNVPRRAMFDEPRHDMQFVHQQHYDMTDATVQLLPKGLANKRLWSKKYPICLLLSKKQSSSCADKKFVPRINDRSEIVLYLFSRTDREKSLWYHRFLRASRAKVGGCHSPVWGGSSNLLEGKRTLSVDFALLQQSSDDDDDGFVEVSMSQQQKFEMYMGMLLGKSPPEGTPGSSTLSWLNVLLGRLFFDILVEDTWARLITHKIQKKINKIKLPFFLSELTVRDIHLGSGLPKIHGASDPWMDEWGLWTDVDLSYNGSFHMTLETKLSFSRFKGEELWTDPQQSMYNEEEDSVESSSEDDFPEDSAEGASNEGGERSRGRKLLKFVDRLAQSAYFQHATKNKYVQKAMNDLSNTPLVLTVQVQWLTGTLALNIPPWPTDRLWYGFRTNPSLSITARPKLGQHVVTFTQVTEWIEKKLLSEFQKVLVMPNMDDLIIPTMQSCQDIISHPDK